MVAFTRMWYWRLFSGYSLFSRPGEDHIHQLVQAVCMKWKRILSWTISTKSWTGSICNCSYFSTDVYICLFQVSFQPSAFRCSVMSNSSFGRRVWCNWNQVSSLKHFCSLVFIVLLVAGSRSQTPCSYTVLQFLVSIDVTHTVCIPGENPC
jgi:hypothetical protein